ncbi:MAG: ATP-dependent RNA helicase DbpA [Myxococcales bacterium]|nr:ATP-dependent RNA helicase DbpA [Myxococcales bacterium]
MAHIDNPRPVVYPDSMNTTFSELALSPELLQAVAQMGFTEMTQVQQKALPLVLDGRDVIAQAKTGSGKTAAFGLGVLEAIETELAAVQALVLCPTRELAEQVTGELRRLAQRLSNTRIVTLCGGKSNHEQRKLLAHGCHIVVGTPGRVGKHLTDGALDVDEVRVLVLDEADRMLDMGFVDEVKAAVRYCPKQRQTLLFSATFPVEIKDLSRQLQRNPAIVMVAAQVSPDKLQQYVYTCERGGQNQLLASLLAHFRPERALVFCEQRKDCDKVADFLSGRGATALALHGKLDQRQRDDVLVQFSNGSASVLVATNVAARGLDIAGMPMVVNYEVSPDPESHVHRIGRTGRAGEAGVALTIVSGQKQHERLAAVQSFMGQRIDPGPAPTGGSGLGFMTPPNQTLLILGGRKDKLRPGDIVGALVKDGGLPGDALGKIDLQQDVCAVAITREHAEAALRYMGRGRVKKKRYRALLLSK